MKRIVTGFDANGKSIVESQAAAFEAEQFGIVLTELWATDRTPADLAARGEPSSYTLEPPPGGSVFRLFRCPPDTEVLGRIQDWSQQSGRQHPWQNPEQYGMHKTQTIDYITVISGRIWLRLDGGEEVELGPGDSVVQRGTMHAWRNHGTEPCLLVAVLIDAG